MTVDRGVSYPDRTYSSGIVLGSRVVKAGVFMNEVVTARPE